MFDLEREMEKATNEWKENTGVMPVDGNAQVEVELDNGERMVTHAAKLRWSTDKILLNIEYWRPAANDDQIDHVDREHLSETFHELPKEIRESILLEAQRLVHSDRNAVYGHPLDDFTRIAGVLNIYLADKLNKPLVAEDIALFNICQKLSRQSNVPKRDNLVDGAGYFETWQWLIDERKRREGTHV